MTELVNLLREAAENISDGWCDSVIERELRAAADELERAEPEMWIKTEKMKDRTPLYRHPASVGGKNSDELERAEPVAWRHRWRVTHHDDGDWFGWLPGKAQRESNESYTVQEEPLYRHPPSAVPDDIKRDAERYRYLKQANIFKSMSLDMSGNHTWTGIGRTIGRGRSVDEAIDAAMLAAQEGEK